MESSVWSYTDVIQSSAINTEAILQNVQLSWATNGEMMESYCLPKTFLVGSCLWRRELSRNNKGTFWSGTSSPVVLTTISEKYCTTLSLCLSDKKTLKCNIYRASSVAIWNCKNNVCQHLKAEATSVFNPQPSKWYRRKRTRNLS